MRLTRLWSSTGPNTAPCRLLDHQRNEQLLVPDVAVSLPIVPAESLAVIRGKHEGPRRPGAGCFPSHRSGPYRRLPKASGPVDEPDRPSYCLRKVAVDRPFVDTSAR